VRADVILRLGVLLLSGGLAACTTTRAAAPVERPPLEVPPVPPRVVEAAPAPDERIEPVGDLQPPSSAPPATKPRPAAPREARETAKPDAKPPDTPPPPTPEAAANVPAVAPPPVIRTPATANTAAVEKQIRDTLTRAQSMLNTVDYQQLSPERKKEYVSAQDFMRSADDRIKASNFEMAKDFAEKAEKLAKELQGR
jgi:hypothetical protein